MTSTLRNRSVTSLRSSLVAWKIRRAKMRRSIAALEKTRTSRTPHTKVTPEQKTARLAALATQLRDTNRSIVALNEAIAFRQMPMRARALTIAREHLGILEHGGNNRGTAVEAIIRANGGTPGEPWCADFDAMCYQSAGSKAVTRAWAAVRNLGRLFGMHTLGSKRLGLAGDLVCYTFDHTGLLDAYCNANGQPMRAATATHVKAIEGNTGTGGAASDSRLGGDGVHERIRDISLVDRVVRVTR